MLIFELCMKCRMVFCMIVGCPNKSKGVPGDYCRVPAVISNQGEAYKEFTKERRRKWTAAINISDLIESIIRNDCSHTSPSIT